MTVLFGVERHPDSWKLMCAHRPERYRSFEEAEAAASAHPDGGCAEGIAGSEPGAHETVQVGLDRKSDFEAGAGEMADICVDAPTMVVADYQERCPEVEVATDYAPDILYALGYGQPGEPGHLDVPMAGTADAGDFLGRTLIALQRVTQGNGTHAVSGWPHISDEVYGRETTVFAGVGADSRPRVEDALEAARFVVHRGYGVPGTTCVQVCYFKGWHWDE